MSTKNPVVSFLPHLLPLLTKTDTKRHHLQEAFPDLSIQEWLLFPPDSCLSLWSSRHALLCEELYPRDPSPPGPEASSHVVTQPPSGLAQNKQWEVEKPLCAPARLWRKEGLRGLCLGRHSADLNHTILLLPTQGLWGLRTHGAVRLQETLLPTAPWSNAPGLMLLTYFMVRQFGEKYWGVILDCGSEHLLGMGQQEHVWPYSELQKAVFWICRNLWLAPIFVHTSAISNGYWLFQFLPHQSCPNHTELMPVPRPHTLPRIQSQHTQFLLLALPSPLLLHTLNSPYALLDSAQMSRIVWSLSWCLYVDSGHPYFPSIHCLSA